MYHSQKNILNDIYSSSEWIEYACGFRASYSLLIKSAHIDLPIDSALWSQTFLVINSHVSYEKWKLQQSIYL